MITYSGFFFKQICREVKVSLHSVEKSEEVAVT